jgi:hypothetical protein
MRFAKIVFITAGVWGIVTLIPLYFLFDVSGRQYAAPRDYPHFFYGFVGVALAWQIAFLIIGSNPARFRAFMIPGLLEKIGFITAVAVLYSRSRISITEASAAVPDIVLAILFAVAYLKTGPAR